MSCPMASHEENNKLGRVHRRVWRLVVEAVMTARVPLILLVVALNLGAILIRNHLRKKYAVGTF